MFATAKRSADALQRRWSPVAVVIAVLKKFGEDRAGNLAALIAYYGFFSLFPLFLVLTTVLGFVLGGDSELRADLADSAFSEIPVIGEQVGEGTLEGNAFGLIVGFAVALWAGTAAMTAAQNAMNEVWKVEMHARPGFVEKRLRALGMLLVLGAGLLISTSVNAVAGALPGVDRWGRFGLFVANLAVDVAVVGAGYLVLTDRRLTLRQIWPGSLLAGSGYLALQIVGSQIVARRIEGASATYGTFATVIGLLTYFFLLAQVTVLAAELNVVLDERLYPRSLDPDNPTDADRRALASHVRAAKRSDRLAIDIDGWQSADDHP